MAFQKKINPQKIEQMLGKPWRTDSSDIYRYSIKYMYAKGKYQNVMIYQFRPVDICTLRVAKFYASYM
jgi:hypothetical protein